MDDTPPPNAEAADRKAARLDVDADVQFRCGTRRAMVKVSNMSTTGARISGVFLVREGDRFFIKFGNLEPIEAVVAWAEDFAFGCKFVHPIHPAVFDQFISAQK